MLLLFFGGGGLPLPPSVGVKHPLLWFSALSGAASDPSGTCGIKGEKRSVPPPFPDDRSCSFTHDKTLLLCESDVVQLLPFHTP